MNEHDPCTHPTAGGQEVPWPSSRPSPVRLNVNDDFWRTAERLTQLYDLQLGRDLLIDAQMPDR